MQPSMPSLLMMLIIASATLMFSVGLVADRGAKDGLSLWAWGLALNTLALVLLGLRGSVSDCLSIIGANTAISGAYALFLAALLQLQSRHISAFWLLSPPLSIFCTFPLFMSDVSARIIISSLVFFTQHVMILSLMMASQYVIKGRGKHLLICAGAIMMTTIFGRAFVIASGTTVITDIAQSSTIQAMMLIASFVALLLGSNGFVLMAKEQADERFQLLAKKDSLTGAWNRAYMQEMALREMIRQKRYGHPVSLIMADIDYFKNVNDRFGHLAGDEALREFTRVVQSCIRSSDALGRWGGEEFLLILPNSALTNAVELAERIRCELAKNNFLDIHKITASFGVAVYQQDEKWEQWLHRTDMGLYRAKAMGRDRVAADDGSGNEIDGVLDPLPPRPAELLQ